MSLSNSSKVILKVTFYTVLLIVIAVLTPVDGDDLIVQLPDITKDKEVICEAIQRLEQDIKVDIDGLMDYDDLLRLTVWNSKYDLRNGAKLFRFPQEVHWKRTILHRFKTIGGTVCPHLFVEPEFLNVVLELFMIYQNSINGSVDHSKEWNELIPTLDRCLSRVHTLDMTSSGYELTGVNLLLDDRTKQQVEIFPPEELADSSQDLDIIIDTMHWLFSLTLGVCYREVQNPSFFSARLKRMFYADFLSPLKKRWLHAGTDTDFGVIFGNFPLKTNVKNLRKCVTAAYTRSGIVDRQLVRSLTLARPGLGIGAGLNKKIGRPL